MKQYHYKIIGQDILLSRPKSTKQKFFNYDLKVVQVVPDYKFSGDLFKTSEDGKKAGIASNFCCVKLVKRSMNKRNVYFETHDDMERCLAALH